MEKQLIIGTILSRREQPPLFSGEKENVQAPTARRQQFLRGHPASSTTATSRGRLTLHASEGARLLHAEVL